MRASRSRQFGQMAEARRYLDWLMSQGRMPYSRGVSIMSELPGAVATGRFRDAMRRANDETRLFTGSTLPFGEMMDNSKRQVIAGMTPHKTAYFEAFESTCAGHGVDPAALVKSAAGYADLLGLIPGGGVLEGMASPETGSSRGETTLLGGGGSVLGALLGGGLGGILTSKLVPGASGEEVEINPLALLAGASLGSGTGNLIGRWLARHEQQPVDIAALQEALRSMQPGSNVTINMADTAGNNIRNREGENE